MKKILAILLSAIMVVGLLAACGNNGGNTPATTGAAPTEGGETQLETQTEARAEEEESAVADYVEEAKGKRLPMGEYAGDLITLACNSGVTSFDPFNGAGGYGVEIFYREKLGHNDNRDGQLKLCMAKSIEQVDDLTYNGEIWDFITDIAGNNITVDDVIWSLEKFRQSGQEGAVNKLQEIEKVDDYHFILHLKEPFAAGEYSKQLSNFWIISQKAYEEAPDSMANNPIGTGPYKLKEFLEGSYGIFEVNEDYWYEKIDDEKWLEENDCFATYHNFKEIRCDVISDASARAIALENGSVDGCDSMNAVDIQNYVANPDMGIKAVDIPVNPPVSLWFNCSENSLCSNIDLRMAICYAIDNAAVADALDVPAYPVYGLQPRMYDAPKEWTTGREYYNFNQAKAKELLEKAGYNGEELIIEFGDGDQRVPSFTLIQAQLAEVGINLTTRVVERNSETPNNVFTGWDMKSATMGGGSYCANTIKRFWSTEYALSIGDGYSVLCIQDPELDRLYEAVLADNSEENIKAWDQYFTYDKCYAYAVCCIYKQTAISTKYNAALFGNQNSLCPGAFSLAEDAE